jgi:hypothetical protein
MKEVHITDWDFFKETCILNKGLKLQYNKTLDNYYVFAVDGAILWFINLSGGSASAKDFKKNYMKDCNKPL